MTTMRAGRAKNNLLFERSWTCEAGDHGNDGCAAIGKPASESQGVVANGPISRRRLVETRAKLWTETVIASWGKSCKVLDSVGQMGKHVLCFYLADITLYTTQLLYVPGSRDRPERNCIELDDRLGSSSDLNLFVSLR